MKRAFGEFHKFLYKMTTNVSFCLTYDPLKWLFITFKMNIILIRKRIVDTDVVNDIMCTRQSVITPVVKQFYDTTLSIE